jgi:antitoxin ParD1/3/4
MPLQSISLTEANADWLKSQVDSNEYISITEAINDLIRQARQQEEEKTLRLRIFLAEGEESIKKYGYSEKSVHDIKQEVLKRKDTPEEIGRLVRQAKVWTIAVEVFGDEERAMAWLQKPTKLFDGLSAMDLLSSEEGALLVEKTLWGINSGFFA